MQTLKVPSQTQSYCNTPSKVYRIRRKIQSTSMSFKKLRVAKKVPSKVGLPKPLTCEEDFVLELKNTPSNFLSPVSGFYELPELEDKEMKIEVSADGDLNPRDIVGSVENFRKVWRSKNTYSIREMLKKNRTLTAFTTQTIKNTCFLLARPQPEAPIEPPKQLSKIELRHKQHQDYWLNINTRIQKQATLKRNPSLKPYPLSQNNIFLKLRSEYY